MHAGLVFRNLMTKDIHRYIDSLYSSDITKSGSSDIVDSRFSAPSYEVKYVDLCHFSFLHLCTPAPKKPGAPAGEWPNVPVLWKAFIKVGRIAVFKLMYFKVLVHKKD
uniref:Uncharacterized protein n=1 Tax=Opuntia streptacantha TaxID=393608 RepID=A0A7C9FID2_OPUST